MTPPRLALALVLLLFPATAAAFEIKAIEIEEVGGKRLGESDLTKYFNRARCECGTEMRVTIRVGSDYQTQPQSSYIEVVSGRNCLDPNNKSIKETECQVLVARQRINQLPGDIVLVTSAAKLMGKTCSGADMEAYSIIVYTDENNDNQWDERLKKDYTVDTQSPSAPVAKSVAAGEGLVSVSFGGHAGETTTTTTDAGTSTTVDKNFKGYQVLCETVAGAPALSSPPAPEYDTARNICGKTTTPTPADAGLRREGMKLYALELGVSDGPAKEAGPREGGPREGGATDAVRDAGVKKDSGGSASAGLEALDKAYVCSARVQAAGAVQVSGLKNGTAYRFYVITIDTAGNPSTPTLVGTATPQLEEDLWERYKRSGGKSSGGHCFVATAAYGSYDHPQVRLLREFRDQVLLRSPGGTAFVLAYYQTSPPLAAWLTRHDGLRPVARALLWPATIAAGAVLYTGTAGRLLLLGLSLLLVGLLVGRTRRGRGGRP